MGLLSDVNCSSHLMANSNRTTLNFKNDKTSMFTRGRLKSVRGAIRREFFISMYISRHSVDGYVGRREIVLSVENAVSIFICIATVDGNIPEVDLDTSRFLISKGGKVIVSSFSSVKEDLACCLSDFRG